MSVLEGINCLAVPVSVTRERSGYYVQGRYQEVAPETFSVTAAVQVVQGRQRQLLPEGVRTRSIIQLFTATELCTERTAAAAKADRVTWRGNTYEVFEVEDWVTDGGYYRVLAASVGQ